MSSNGYHQLTRGELRGFNDEALAMIAAAMAAGAVGRVSNRGHAILRAPGGGTMSVSKDPTKANRGLQNQLSDFRRIFGMEPSAALTKKESAVATATAPAPPPKQENPDPIRCEAKGCNRVFVTQGALYSHVQRDHVPCRVPGCQFAAVDKRGEAAHYRMHHKGDAKTQRQGLTKHPEKQEEAKPDAELNELRRRLEEAEKVAARVRDVLGPDPRVKDLQRRLDECAAKNEELRRELGEAQAKLKLMKEALDL